MMWFAVIMAAVRFSWNRLKLNCCDTVSGFAELPCCNSMKTLFSDLSNGVQGSYQNTSENSTSYVDDIVLLP